MTSEDPQAAAGTCQIPDTYTRRWTPRRVEKPVEGPEKRNRPIARGWLAAIGSRWEAPRRLCRGSPTRRSV